jgi:hypothetical protein
MFSESQDPIRTFRTFVGEMHMLVTYKKNLDRLNVGRAILVPGVFFIVFHLAVVCFY